MLPTISVVLAGLTSVGALVGLIGLSVSFKNINMWIELGWGIKLGYIVSGLAILATIYFLAAGRGAGSRGRQSGNVQLYVSGILAVLWASTLGYFFRNGVLVPYSYSCATNGMIVGPGGVVSYDWSYYWCVHFKIIEFFSPITMVLWFVVFIFTILARRNSSLTARTTDEEMLAAKQMRGISGGFAMSMPSATVGNSAVIPTLGTTSAATAAAITSPSSGIVHPATYAQRQEIGRDTLLSSSD
ncbi:hypothetical protein GQ42DRAFT_170622 [Ramicandelaber brevisporus]|nr:hypothetical protein GQ42DRAFT_170622 [Ramicandelaber brevisporus]